MNLKNNIKLLLKMANKQKTKIVISDDCEKEKPYENLADMQEVCDDTGLFI
ncbi:hypothetical protein SAMN03080594_102189 [Arenibacter palladensis]|uniref:Uncharacterized protein n=1 Tax=Arenibacter palladensis TaxID=237373 RepID=A0A1M4XT24_9FLAO|nr:hypothetical protein [Arenibacter palladensis]SHE96595.1 hypothetical protein SAMN03080594_102189 [Arenibacter palladensis]